MQRKVQVWLGTRENDTSAKVILFKLVDARGGGWHPVTGGVEKGETFFEAAKREMEEETGISPDAGEWLDLKYSHFFEGRWGRAEEHCFGFILKHDHLTIHLDPSEMTEFRWAGLDEAMQSVHYEQQRHALKLFSWYLQG